MTILCKVFGVVATYLILAVVSALLIMFITDRFIFSSLGKNGVKQIKNLKTYQENVRAERKQYYEEQEETEDIEIPYSDMETSRHKHQKVVTFPKNKKLEYTNRLDTKAINKKLKKKEEEISAKNENQENSELTPEERNAILRAQKKSRQTLYEKPALEEANKDTAIEETDTKENITSKKVPLYKEVLMNKFKKKPSEKTVERSYAFISADEEKTVSDSKKTEDVINADEDVTSDEQIVNVSNTDGGNDVNTNNIENTDFVHNSITDSDELSVFQDQQNDLKEEMTATITDVQEFGTHEIIDQSVSDSVKENSREEMPEEVLEKITDYTSTESAGEDIVINDEQTKPEEYTENEIDETLNTSVYDPIEQEDTVSPEANLEKLTLPVTASTANTQIKPIVIEKASTPNTSNMDELNKAIEIKETKPHVFPPIDLLEKPNDDQQGMSDDEIREKAVKLKQTLDSFGVRVTITDVSCGPTVTRFELQPEQGVKVSKITGLTDDIKLNLAAADIRIEAPIPGKAAVGIEVPNSVNTMVMLRDLVGSKEFKSHKSNVAFAVGKDIGGNAVVTDVAKMPHLLIAGATGSGKSVCINTLIMSILYKADPKDVKLIMIDPKVVELSVYNGIPHLLIPVVTDPKKASGALSWAVTEMTDRYNKFAELGVREINGYNEKVAAVEDANDPRFQKMPQIVIIVDELADLMMVEPGEVEESICRLAQLARAAGIHLVIATQRPSVNVITGLIKANIPSRIAFAVSSAIDSRTILDGGGAEKLLGKGDMLFFPSGFPKPVRVQGAFVSDSEVTAVVDFLKQQVETPQYNETINQQIETIKSTDGAGAAAKNERDDYFIDAGKFIIEKDKASIGMLQRVFKVGFNRAARIMDQLSEAGVVGPEEGTKPRKVLMSLEQFENYIDEYY